MAFIVRRPGAAPEPTGVWSNVTPGDADLAIQFGFNGMLADPITAGVAYAFKDGESVNLGGGIWRTTSASGIWTRRDNPANSVIQTGKNWGPCILSTGRILNCSGNNFEVSDGKEIRFTVQRSDDGGATWALSNTTTAVPYNLSPNPADNNIVLFCAKDTNDLGISYDGGVTVAVLETISGIGGSAYVFWATATRALIISQSGSGNGLYLGVFNGTTFDSWTLVDTLVHTHGVCQPYIDTTNSVVFMAGDVGIMKASFANLSSWSSAFSGDQRDCIWASPATLFSGSSFPAGYLVASPPPNLRSAARPLGTSWSAADNPAGINMYQGPRMACTVLNPAGQSVSLTANWNAGLFRRVEAA